MIIPVLIRERIFIPRIPELKDMYSDLRSRFTHKNPDFYKRRSQKRWTGNIKSTVDTWDNVVIPEFGPCLAIPRGGTKRLREIFDIYEVKPTWHDHRVSLDPITDLNNDVTLWPDQQKLADIMFKKQNCLIRSPTGSGKTEVLLKVAEWILNDAGPVLIIVWEGDKESGLFKQWIDRIKLRFGLTEEQIGTLGGRTKKKIRPLTVAMQQTLIRNPRLYSHKFGGVICDEIQRWAAPTFQKTMDVLPSKYRFGASADECVARGTMITLDNGIQCPIESIIPGDYVATPIGPRKVTGVFNTGIRETQTVTIESTGNILHTTLNTLFASHGVWKESPFHVYLRNEQRQIMSGVWETDAKTLQRELPHEMHSDNLQQRRNLQNMRRIRSIGERSTRSTLSSTQRRSMVKRSHKKRPPIFDEYIEESIRCQERETCTLGIGEHTNSLSHTRSQTKRYEDPKEESKLRTIRRETIWERSETSTIRIKSIRNFEPFGIHPSICCSNGERCESSTSLQDRSSTTIKENRSRDRRFESQNSRQKTSRQTKRSPSVETRLDNSEIPSDIRCSRIAKCCDDISKVTITPGIFTQTFDLEIDDAHCYYANDVLVHNTRNDGKEFLIYDMFGEVAGEVEKAKLVSQGKIHEVVFRVVPTDFQYEVHTGYNDDGSEAFTPWIDLPSEDKNFNNLLKYLIDDEDRNNLIWEFVKSCLKTERTCIMGSARVDHSRYWDKRITDAGFKSGLMLGGTKMSAEFERSAESLRNKQISIGVGTTKKIAQGHDIPALDRGFIITPIAQNKQLLEQFAGRLRRTHKDKNEAVLYYFWDRHIYPSHAKKIARLYKGHTQLLVDGEFLDI